MHNTGTLYILSAASGTGKTSLAKALAEKDSNVKISISHTTRPLRPSETPDQSYFFVNNDFFNSLVDKEVFLEHAWVFDYQYGTSRIWVEEQLNNGIDVILDIDWQGAEQIRNKIECVSIFLLPPSKEELKLRLKNRKRESDEIIESRLAQASNEISHYKEFDYIVINDRFETALEELSYIIQSNRLQSKHQIKKYGMLLKELTK